MVGRNTNPKALRQGASLFHVMSFGGGILKSGANSLFWLVMNENRSNLNSVALYRGFVPDEIGETSQTCFGYRLVVQGA